MPMDAPEVLVYSVRVFIEQLAPGVLVLQIDFFATATATRFGVAGETVNTEGGVSEDIGGP